MKWKRGNIEHVLKMDNFVSQDSSTNQVKHEQKNNHETMYEVTLLNKDLLSQRNDDN